MGAMPDFIVIIFMMPGLIMMMTITMMMTMIDDDDAFYWGAMLEFSHLMLAGVQSKHAVDSSWGRFCSLFSSSSTSSSYVTYTDWYCCHLSNAFGILDNIYCIAARSAMQLQTN